MKKQRKNLCLATLLSLCASLFFGIAEVNVEANSTPQTLPFSQNWTNIGLITANDDWSGVPGIQGFQGNDITTATGADPRTLLADGGGTTLDVIANVANCDTNTAGGIAECEGAGGNPTIALQGSGTADVPHIVIYLNTTGQNNIRVAYNARDVDGSADNTNQQINTQYRVGNTGDFINLPGGYIPDATTGPMQASLVTPVAVTLPAAANNQPLVEVRITSTNAPGSDEWVGIDDISVTTVATVAPNRANVDFNGDGRSDWVVNRFVGTLTQWFVQNNGSSGGIGVQFGVSTDRIVPEDYDGDGRDDIAVWRPNSQSFFYILRSSNGTVQSAQFGISSDNPAVVGDYDGDGRADQAVFRANGTATDPCGIGRSVWYFRPSGSPAVNFSYRCWGINGDVPTGGDFDGDGRVDFCVRRNDGGAGNFYLLRSSDSGIEVINWGLPTDAIVPGDYDGDARSDFCLARINAGVGNFYILERDGGGTGATPIVFGNANTDFLAPGDYDGDGRQDIAVWRPNADPTQNFFFVLRSSNSALQTFEWGQNGDEPAAEWNVTGGGN